ncbi:MAG: BamA/TamA family outer membrane protein [Bacteroidales bacterium]|nr:BamA/TamA family outer membrane protein [Bacteroidales bacterium]
MLRINRFTILLLIFVFGLVSAFGQNKGKKPHYAVALSIDSATYQLLRQSNTLSFCRHDLLNLEDYPRFSQQIVSYYENNGFPFVEVRLDSLGMEERQASAKLVVDRHEYVVFDSIIVSGDAKLSRSYLYPYLGWRRKKGYRESVVADIPSKLAELPFVTEAAPSSIEFVNDKCYLYLYLNRRKCSQFDGYIGLVPVDDRTGKVSLNGELNLDLRNLFKIGERIALQWRSTERYSQNLTVALNFPYLFRTPLGVDGQFLLDKKDTSYLNMNYLIGLQYSFMGNSYAKVYFDYTTSRVLAASALSPSSGLMDYNKSMYGIEFNIRRLDYIYNPRKGVSFLIDGSVGRRKIVRNAKADESFYEGLEMRSSSYRLRGELMGFVPLHRRWVLVLGANGGTMFGNYHYMNELYRIGGMNSLQGFDEKALYCSSYAIALTELRFLFAKRSYINAFFNAAWYERNIPDNYFHDFPFGFGLGLSFDTKAGMFYLSYALGHQHNSPISFKTGKIHFGVKVGF